MGPARCFLSPAQLAAPGPTVATAKGGKGDGSAVDLALLNDRVAGKLQAQLASGRQLGWVDESISIMI